MSRNVTILLLGSLALFIMLSGCLGGGVSCSGDSQCQQWQYCNQTDKACKTATGYCASDVDCNDTLMQCDLNATHTCVYKEGNCLTDVNCESWQVCTSNKTCEPAPGYCGDNSQCDQSTDYCNPSNHLCSPKPGYCTGDTDCNAWEKCDVSSKKCVLMPGHCNADTDCQSWQACDAKSYLCIAKQGFCGNDA